MKINENIAYARSILNKSGINQDSDEYKDYLKIREICGNNNGYVGILTKIRFVDNVEDMEEISSIFDVLKNSKIDINKLNRMSYDEILEIFYEELGGKIDKTDIELIYKDDQYSYYRVYTYKGILKIGSPAWCLKTKSYWDNYQSKWPEQWVVIDNRMKNKMLSPDNNYLSDYSNRSKAWARYGISVRSNDNGTINWTSNDDNNGTTSFKPESFTFFGVMCTILNLTSGIKKSYYERFKGCKKISDRWLKVENIEDFCDWMEIEKNNFSEGDEPYVFFSKSYSHIPIIITFNDVSISALFPTSRPVEANSVMNKPLELNTNHHLFLKHCEEERDIIYSGIKLKNNLIQINDIEKIDQFIKIVDNWIIFNRNKNYYLMVNTLENVNELQIPSYTLYKGNHDMDNPAYWYLDKRTMKPWKSPIRDFHQKIIDNIINDDSIIKEKPEVKKVGKFWDFFKRNKK